MPGNAVHRGSIPVDADLSVITTGLFQTSRRYMILGVDERYDLITTDRMVNIGATDLQFWDLERQQTDWTRMQLPLLSGERILGFHFDEMNETIAISTWMSFLEDGKDPVSRARVFKFPTGQALADLTCTIKWNVACDSPPVYVSLRGDLVGMRMHEQEHLSHLRIWNWRRGTLLVHHTCARGDQGLAFAYLSNHTVMVANRKTLSLDLIPISMDKDRHIHRLQIPPSLLPPPPPELDASHVVVASCYAGTDYMLGQFYGPTGDHDSTEVIVKKAQLIKHSSEIIPAFPAVSTNQLVDGIVLVPWSQWSHGARVSHKLTGHMFDRFTVSGNWQAERRQEAPINSHPTTRILINDLANHDKVVIDETLEDDDLIFDAHAQRLFGLRLHYFGEHQEFITLEEIDIWEFDQPVL
ncbi:hypothetical protein CYLTODRAFT_423966 [Cylindrobasidium torrendii FP15055 ss-10]|uniref:Uncharacterized protein n=1 Tax=Cylindrobasidium torrendii FP15055 ss-10 TaxID=1314674 RepID=A0A0D7B5Q8_9AGAR|nr:hypothetical protein CYLTODRAFT_423966 [Cylindrobasidium torrendii FP15055 ss-10]